VIDGDQVRVDETDFTVPGLNLGKNETINQDREALAARHRGQNIGSLSGLGEDLDALGMIGAIHIAYVIGPSSGCREKTAP
jgi:hypothetical protein